MFDSLLTQALVAACGVSLISAPMGCVLLWRRLVFFADSLSHSMLLGVAIGLILSVSPIWIFVVLSAFFAFLLRWAIKLQISDIMLAISSYGALALALLLFQLFPTPGGLESYLLGDILLITISDITMLLVCFLCVDGFLFYFWREHLLLALGQDIAVSEGVRADKINLILFYLFSITIGFVIKLTGALLAPALMIIPAYIAKRISTSPEGMMFKSVAVSLLISISAVFLAFHFDFAIGPVMVLVAIMILLFSVVIFRKTSRW